MSKTKVIGKRDLVDPATGEVVQTITLLPRSEDREPYVKVFKLFASKVLEDLGTMNVECKILLWMLSQRALMRMQASGWTDCPQDLLGFHIGVTRVAVNKAMKRLKEKGYIEQRRPKSQTWRIKPDLCFRGSLSNYWKNVSEANDGPIDVWCPWSDEDYARMQAGEQPLPGMTEAFEHHAG